MARGVQKEKKSNRITFRMTPTEIDRLNKVSKSLEINVSQTIRKALKNTFEI
jgi:hypothetical protein